MKVLARLPLFIAPLVVIFTIGRVKPIQAAPFTADPQTLLLASFDKRPDLADYANGWDRFGGGGYPLVKGYYGQAVDVRGVNLPDNFWDVGHAFLPHLTQWIFWPRGNISFRQGTLEFWFRPAADGLKRAVMGGNDLLYFQSFQPLRPELASDYQPLGLPPLDELARAAAMKKLKAVQPYIRLTTKQFSWVLITLEGKKLEGSVDFAKVPGWSKALDPEQWYHFALQWSPEGVAFYLDGRLLGGQALAKSAGIALTGPTQRGLAINGVIFDELRISAQPRYSGEFEPNWRDGARPANAFPGIKGMPPIVWQKHLLDLPLALERATGTSVKEASLGKWRLGFDLDSGNLATVANEGLKTAANDEGAGLLLWAGVDRDPLPSPHLEGPLVETGTGTQFSQQWTHGLRVGHVLRTGANGEIRWQMEFKNEGKENLWLEALLALPVPKSTSEYFDMSWKQTSLPFPRRRDEYIFSLPMVAASDGADGLGIGLDPRKGASALIGEWLPGGPHQFPFIRQGTRVVLAPGETQKLDFVVFRSSGQFGTQDSIAAYQDLFPELYKLNPAIPLYTYLGVCQYFSYVSIPDLTRVYYSGGQWGHGPHHANGDYLGTVPYWGRTDLKDRGDYQRALANERLYKSIEGLRSEVVRQSRDAFNNFYTPRRSHDVPNLTARFIIDDLTPGLEFPDDPLAAGQYFAPDNLVVNEYHTPLGDKFATDQANVMRQIGQYSPGFINDFCQTASFRFTDAYARQSPGRAFSEDRGEYLVAAFGSMERYKMINGFSEGGSQQSMISDWGLISYMLSGYSAANAFESGDPFIATTGMEIGLQVSRNLLGEKPTSVLTSYGLDNIGDQFSPEDFTPERLRDYYRFAFRQLMLTAMETGYYADPALLHGKQWNSEVNPILVESLVYGRKTVAGARTSAPFWIVRGGDDANSIVIAGNKAATDESGPLELLNQYFGGRYLWAPYFGGSLDQDVTDQSTKFTNLQIGAHDIEAFKPVAELIGTQGRTTAEWSGDGLELKIRLTVNMDKDGTLRVLRPAEFYEISAVRIGGNSVAWNEGGVFGISAGKNEIEVVLRNRVLAFSAADWEKVQLIRDGKTDFGLLGTTQPGYEWGTASQLNWFLRQYDEEDGVIGNLVDAKIYSSEKDIPNGYSGWILDVRPDPLAIRTEVNLEPGSRRIRFVGRTPGEVRRGMMVFMRLLDRKYPHIGRLVPLDGNLQAGWKTPGWNSPYDPAKPSWKRLYERRPKTLRFFEAFSDSQFLLKPILEKEHEELYAGGSLDFAGKYRLRQAPYLFEPTFSEDYIYGYHGPRFEEAEKARPKAVESTEDPK